MALVVSGLLNKQVGGELRISEITVKAHRGKVMQKMRRLPRRVGEDGREAPTPRCAESLILKSFAYLLRGRIFLGSPIHFFEIASVALSIKSANLFWGARHTQNGWRQRLRSYGCGLGPHTQRFKVGVDGSVFCSYHIQLGLLLHAAVVMTALKLSAALNTCDRAMKAPAQQADRLRSTHETARIKVSETIYRLLYRR